MYLTRIELQNWRNFQQADIPLERRTFIVGPNASGKSNLLAAFRFLQAIAEPEGGFRRAVEGLGGVSQIRCLHARRHPNIVVAVDLHLHEVDWSYRLEFGQNNQRTPYQQSRLKKINKALQVAVPQLKELKLERDDRGIPHLKGLYEHWRPNAGWQSEEHFSDGTLRLLGLLWAILDGDAPLLLEEPELSLHSAVVRHIPSMMARAASTKKARRQILVSTHSPELLSDEGIAPEEVVLLRPTSESTEVLLASKIPEVRSLLEGGISIADAVLPLTAPPEAAQLALFGT